MSCRAAKCSFGAYKALYQSQDAAQKIRGYFARLSGLLAAMCMQSMRSSTVQHIRHSNASHARSCAGLAGRKHCTGDSLGCMLAIQCPTNQQRSSRVANTCDRKSAHERLMLRSSPHRLADAQCATRAAGAPHSPALTAAAAVFTSRATHAALRGCMGSACRTVLQQQRCGAAIRHRQHCKAAAMIARSCRACPANCQWQL